MSGGFRTAAQIRHESVKADVLRLLDGLPEANKSLFWRIYPLGLDHLKDDQLGAAHALVLRSAKKRAGVKQ